MRTIDCDDWLKGGGKTARRARFILDHFDLKKLRRRRKSPGRARALPRPRRRG
jgi:hypothetical protein